MFGTEQTTHNRYYWGPMQAKHSGPAQRRASADTMPSKEDVRVPPPALGSHSRGMRSSPGDAVLQHNPELDTGPLNSEGKLIPSLSFD